MQRRLAFSIILIAFSQSLLSCAYLPQNPNYMGPPARPMQVSDYYSVGASYGSYVEKEIKIQPEYIHKKILLSTASGVAEVDYFDNKKDNNNLILVFPVLGGKPIIATHFAMYFARKGFNTAIVNRQNDFKDPANFDRLEEIFRANVIRDRIVLDFFQNEKGIKQFGTFGVSRGAINVAISAGVDPRLKFNVMAMGGTDLVNLFSRSTDGRIEDYRKRIAELKQVPESSFKSLLEGRIKTDPEYLAVYIDARKTLLFLSLFDKTVPIAFGRKLRRQIGEPRTVYLMADHFTGILYSQVFTVLPEDMVINLPPVDYIEKESLVFYRKSFESGRRTLELFPFSILQLPLNIIAGILQAL